MSTIQDLAPYIEGYQPAIKAAKNAKGYTIQRLADESGVSYSAVAKLMNDTQANPLLYNGVALCKVLGLSLDKLFGLEPAPDSPGELQARIHELEIQLAQAETRAELYRNAYNKLLVALILILPIVIGYLIWDVQYLSAGVFQASGVSVLAVPIIITVVITAAILLSALRIFKNM